MIRRLIAGAVVIAVAVGAYFAYTHWSRPAAPPQVAAPPPPEVGIVVVQPAEVPFPVEYAGRVVGFRDVEIRSLVGGILLERGFEEGGRVKQGQRLFLVDPAPYRVALQRAEAQQAQAQATLRQAEENFTRVEELFGRGVSTQRQRDEAVAARDQARAAVQLAQAEIAGAKLNLSHTEINAPVNGVTSLQSPPIGTLIQAQATLLTTITPLDPAYVSFSFTDEEGRAFRELNAKRAKPLAEQDLVVELQFGAGAVYGKTGKIDTAAQRVDPATGTIQARAIFPNEDGDILPGQFVRVRIRGITLPDAIVIPKEGVNQGPQGPAVFVVGANDAAEPRPVKLGPELHDGWVIQEGLRGGDRVIVDGILRVRPGAPVRPVPKMAQGQAAPGGGSQGGGTAPAGAARGGAAQGGAQR